MHETNDFYLRPVLAFGYHRWLHVCVHVCVSITGLSAPLVQARITKFRTKVQKTLLKVRIVFGDGRFWPSRSNLTGKSNFTFELVCPITNQLFKLESPNMEGKCILAVLRFLFILDLIGFDLYFHFQSWNRFFYQIYLRSFCIIFSETRRW